MEDNKTKVSNKFVALKSKRKATGNDPVDIKLTERDEKIIGLLGFDYMEGSDTVPDSFPEEHNIANELLTDGKDAILDFPPQATSIKSILLTVEKKADLEMDDTSTPQQPEQGPSRVEESLPGTSSSILGKRTVSPISRSQFIRRGKHHERLGIQLQHAQSEFAELAQRICEATELMAQAEMKRAEAALIIGMANNDKVRNEIRTMAENDKARNVVLVSLVGTLDALLRK